MRFKIDENLGPTVASVFAGAGHDVATVVGQSLQGVSDDALEAVCRVEDRVLVTADLDFANVTRFPPAPRPGTVVLRPHRHDRNSLESLARAVLPVLDPDRLTGALWIVQPGGIRVFEGA